MRAYQTSGHLPVAVAQAFVLTRRPTRGADTSAQAICDLILTSRRVWLGGALAIAVEEGERAALNFQRKDFEIVQQDQVRDPSPTNRAVSICCRMFSVMSEVDPGNRTKS
jgi:hypothetical protein